jgi:UDP-GlcNAc:undecaprenyl-phosphate GlcNAc-1-phosphate transferase
VKTYFGLFFIATFASLAITPIIRRLCERYDLLDVPTDDRRLHLTAVPRLGGIAIFLSCLIALSTLPFVDNLLTQYLREHKPELLLAFIPATLVLLLGVYDDLRGTNAIVKFLVLGLIASLFYWLGGRIDALSIPFLGSVHLPVAVSFIVTVLWLVGITNAFNLIDGLDGLASGAALFSTLVILAISISQGRPLQIVVSLVLCGALAGFLRYNFNPASIFLGDSGALFIGFTLAALSVVGTQKATTAVAIVIPVLAFGFPMVDTAITMARRLIGGRPLFQGDREHIHHMLLSRGWSQRQAALILYGVCAAFALLAIMFTTTGSKLTGFLLFVVSVATIIAVGHLRYHEVDELKAGVKRTVAERRLRVANNIRVRRAARALSTADDLYDLFEAVRVMLEFGEFNVAKAQLGQAANAETVERAFKASGQRHPKQQLELGGHADNSRGVLEFRKGRIYWSWVREGFEREEASLRSSWCFRLPLMKDRVEWGWLNLYRRFESGPLLVDVNYLGDLFRRELIEAAERIFREAPLETAEVAGSRARWGAK